MLKFIVRLKLFILCFTACAAVIPVVVCSQQFQFTHYDIENGLLNNNVRSIAQDKLGQMYFGTNHGLYVYDGSSFKLFNLPGDGNDRPVTTASQLKDGSLFMSYEGNNQYYNIKNGSLKRDTISGRLVIEKAYDGIAANTLLCANQGLFKVSANRLEKISLGLSNADRMISALLPVGANKILVARKGYPVGIISANTLQKTGESKESVHVNDVIEDFSGNIWLATETFGLMLLQRDDLLKNNVLFKPVPEQLKFLADKKEAILSFAFNKKDSTLLIGTAEHGLVIFKPGNNVIQLDYKSGLSSNRVNSVFTGNNNEIWIGTNRGVDKIENTDIVVYGRTFDSNTDNIYTTNVDCNNRMWFFKSDYMYYFDGNDVRELAYPKGAEKIPLSCANTTSGFWLTLPMQLVYIDCKSNTPAIKNIIKTETVYRRLHEWGNDAIILASDDRLAIMEKGKISVLTDSIKMVRSLLKDRYGKLWVGTYDNGLYRLEIKKIDGRWTSEQLYRYYDRNKTYNRFLALTEDSSGKILASNKYQGIYVFNDAERRSALVARLNKTNGLLNDDITSLFTHPDGTVWYGTKTGINKMWLINGSIISKNLSNIYNIYNSVSKINYWNKNVWIATDGGFYKIKQAASIAYKIPVYFKELVFPTGGFSLFTTDTAIRLKSNQNTFTVNFTAPFFINENQTRYFYKLVSNNSEGQWNKISGNKSINFSGLTHGSYILQLSATAYNDIPGNHISSLTFYIDKPFYLQAWFIILASLLLFLLLFSLYSWRISQVKKIFQVRNAISKDLHDEIGATLSSINIYSDIAQSKVNGNKEVVSLLGRIYQGSQQALESINDIVWYVDPRNDNFESIVVKMQDFAVPVLEAKNIATTFDVHENVLTSSMTMQVRQSTYRIFKEAINNILKYSQANKVLVKITKAGNYVSLKIEDDGKGFNPSEVKKGNGLNNMITRAAAMNGIFSIDAAPGKGCRIQLLCPIT